MTVYGYARVNPDAPAGGLDRLVAWLAWQGCEYVCGDVEYAGRRRVPPAMDDLLHRVKPGDRVLTPDLLMLHRHIRALHRRGCGSMWWNKKTPRLSC